MTSRLSSAINSLEPLLGTWSVKISVPNMPDFFGRIVFEPIVNGSFVLMKTVIEGDGPPDSICMFGGDQDERFFQMLYSDERGTSRVYSCVFNGRRWEMWRRTDDNSQRFRGLISDDGDIIDACWENSADGLDWQVDFDMRFERQAETADGREQLASGA